MRRLPMLIAILIVVFAIGIFALTRYLERDGVFFPSKQISINPAMMRMPYEDLMIQTPDQVRINAWFCPYPEAQTTVIMAHGNAGNMSDRLLKIKFWHTLGISVMAFDYRGYGKSEGVPTEEGIYTDIVAVYDYLKTRQDINMDKVFVYGASMGGIAAVDLAGKRPVKALITDATITSAKEAARTFYPYIPSIFLRIKFDSISKIKTITQPKLFIHSREDKVVPYWMGEKLFAVAPEPKTFVTSHGGHNEIQIATDKPTVEAIKKFLEENNL